MGETSPPSDYSSSPLNRLWSYVFGPTDFHSGHHGDMMSDTESTHSNGSHSRLRPPKGGDHGATAGKDHRTSWGSSSSGDDASVYAAAAAYPYDQNKVAGGGISRLMAQRGGPHGQDRPQKLPQGFDGEDAAREAKAASSAAGVVATGGSSSSGVQRSPFAQQLHDFPHSLPKGCEPVSAVVLSYWDNICGPKIEKTWGHHPGGDDLFLYVTKHSLNGEMFRQSISQLESKFYVLGDQGVAVSAFIFSGFYTPTTESKYTMCLIIPMNKLSAYLSYHPIVIQLIPSLIEKLVTLQKRSDRVKPSGSSRGQQTSTAGLIDPMEKFSKMIVKFVADFHLAQESALPADIHIQDTIFGPVHESLISRTFLKLILTSFLQSHGCIVLIGATPQIVNTVILSLALFLTPDERRRCTLCSRSRRSYHPGFFIQGFLPFEELAYELSHANLLQAPYPTTIVDLSTHTVQQVCSYHNFSKLKKSRADLELHALTKDLQIQDSWLQDGLMSAVTTPCTFVSTLVAEIFVLPVVLRLPHINHSMMYISRKAISLVEFIHSTMRESTHKIAFIPQPALRKIMSDLSLSELSYFYLILATAEKLKPGIYYEALGDNMNLEDKFVEMIESF